jgi:hypothetical protein
MLVGVAAAVIPVDAAGVDSQAAVAKRTATAHVTVRVIGLLLTTRMSRDD